jgi:hypothetical protein
MSNKPSHSAREIFPAAMGGGCGAGVLLLLLAAARASVLVPIERNTGWTHKHTANVMDFVHSALIEISQSPDGVLEKLDEATKLGHALVNEGGVPLDKACPKTDWANDGICVKVCECMASELLYGITQALPYKRKYATGSLVLPLPPVRHPLIARLTTSAPT